MVDNKHDIDEYQFAAMEDSDPDLDDESVAFGDGEVPLDNKQQLSKAMIKKGLLVLGGFVVILVSYKMIGAFFSDKSEPNNHAASMIKAPIQAPHVPQVMPQSQQTLTTAVPGEINQRLSTLSNMQEKMQTDIGNFNSNLNSISTTVNDLVNKIDQLSKVVSLISNNMAQQTSRIAALTVKQQRLLKNQSDALGATKQRPIYYIQALIPGRAWLMAANGTTITVREGSNVSGYGIVKNIDTQRGRILTSKGRIIGFSQQDA